MSIYLLMMNSVSFFFPSNFLTKINGKQSWPGMTALQLLSCNPLAFQSGCQHGFLKNPSSKRMGKVQGMTETFNSHKILLF